MRQAIKGLYLREKSEAQLEEKKEPGFMLIDLPNFGQKLEKSEENFRSITEQRVKELELLQPPKL